ncbi:hypothetical protein Tco_0761858 [Tanacetum coccineum]
MSSPKSRDYNSYICNNNNGDHALALGCLLGIFMEIKRYRALGHDKPLQLADMLLYSWDRGLDVCVDLTGSSPLTQTEMTGFVPSRAVIDATQRKRVKYDTKCAAIGYDFLPFSFSFLWELEKDAVTLLKRIRKFSMTQDIGARVAVYIFNRICFVIAKGPRTYNLSTLPFQDSVQIQKVPENNLDVLKVLEKNLEVLKVEEKNLD